MAGAALCRFRSVPATISPLVTRGARACVPPRRSTCDGPDPEVWIPKSGSRSPDPEVQPPSFQARSEPEPTRNPPPEAPAPLSHGIWRHHRARQQYLLSLACVWAESVSDRFETMRRLARATWRNGAMDAIPIGMGHHAVILRRAKYGRTWLRLGQKTAGMMTGGAACRSDRHRPRPTPAAKPHFANQGANFEEKPRAGEQLERRLTHSTSSHIKPHRAPRLTIVAPLFEDNPCRSKGCDNVRDPQANAPAPLPILPTPICARILRVRSG